MSLKDWRRLLPDQLPRTGYCAYPDSLRGGNTLGLLHDGREAYPAMIEAISSARMSVHLETYILRGDSTGWRFLRALEERSRRGVQVRVAFDSIGSLGLGRRFVQAMHNSGIQALEYHPIAPWRRRWSIGRRDHRKILTVDGRVAFTGGINIADDHADPSEGGAGWRDLHVRIEGPAAHELDRLFRQLWQRETGRRVPMGETPRSAGGAFVHVAANQEFIKRQLIRKAFLYAIRRARRRIVIANPYFIPDRGIRAALYDACGRGVETDVLIPSASDVPAAAYAGRRLFEEHMRRGVRLYAWPGSVLHAKAMTVDRSWAAVGSYNFTHRSLKNNLEVNLHILDDAFAGELEDALLADIRRSHALTPEAWASRPPTEKLLELLFHPLRHWF